jgi:hypothetical protein
MSFYFAQIDENNLVVNVIVTDSLEWCQTNLDGTWLETKEDKSIRKNFAGIGYIYDEERNAFIPPKPFNSWLLNEDSCVWESPIPYPDDENIYVWNEDEQSWDEVE